MEPSNHWGGIERKSFCREGRKCITLLGYPQVTYGWAVSVDVFMSWPDLGHLSDLVAYPLIRDPLEQTLGEPPEASHDFACCIERDEALGQPATFTPREGGGPPPRASPHAEWALLTALAGDRPVRSVPGGPTKPRTHDPRQRSRDYLLK